MGDNVSQNPKQAKATKLRIVSKLEIESKNISKDELWLIILKNKIVGPYHKNDIKAFLDENPLFPKSVKVANYTAPDNHIPIYNVTEFQRRKPQVLVNSSGPQVIDKIFILINGQKNGPYSMMQIKELLKEKTLLFNDLISVDGGINWIKLHECTQLDRRQLFKQGILALPEGPKTLLSGASDSNLEEDILISVRNKKKLRDESEGLIGLAYIGQIKGKNSFSNDENNDDYDYVGSAAENENVNENNNSSISIIRRESSGFLGKYLSFRSGSVLLTIIILGGALYYYIGGDNNKNNTNLSSKESNMIAGVGSGNESESEVDEMQNQENKKSVGGVSEGRAPAVQAPTSKKLDKNSKNNHGKGK
ncbi:MAG: DUF4339 domain-containing protein [Oligoflexia bacterium]|nr:DUF4339 domain-containing protein [Oligoflexia bacterium]